LGLFSFCSALALAAEQAVKPESVSLPEPLTLEDALRLADSKHPDLLVAEAAVQFAEAQSRLVESESGVKARVFARLQAIRPNEIAFDQSQNDSRLGLQVTKRLYDFGRSKGKQAASQAEVRSQEFLYLSARQAQHLKITQLFFDVLLADLQFFRDNEDMAVKFVRLDRLRDRNELGQVSDLEVLEQETRFQKARRQRLQSQNRQRITRTRLAVALNRPKQVPETLVPPPLTQLDRQLGEVEDLQEQAVQGNYRMKALQTALTAAQQRRNAAQAEGGPVLLGNAEATAYARQSGSYDKWRVGVELDYPLFDSGTADSELARAQARVFELEAELASLEQDIRLAVLDLWLEMDTLRIDRQEAQVNKDFSDLFLDKSRALYEMEARPNLGDAMTRITDSELRAMRADLRTALAWKKLDALMGNLVSSKEQSVTP
jgi:outer membrane protein TolC